MRHKRWPVDAPVWIFDLDNTLHNASHGVFPRINCEMTAFIMRRLSVDEREAHRLRELYWQRYGATLEGLRRHHGVPPPEFLRETHPLNALMEVLLREAHVPRILSQLPGRKIVLSNGPLSYVTMVVRHLRLHRHFEALLGAECMGFQAKPRPNGYRQALLRLNVPASRCIMVEDSLVNLRQAKRLGMKTVWLTSSNKRPVGVDWRIRHLRELLRCV